MGAPVDKRNVTWRPPTKQSASSTQRSHHDSAGNSDASDRPYSLVFLKIDSGPDSSSTALLPSGEPPMVHNNPFDFAFNTKRREAPLTSRRTRTARETNACASHRFALAASA